MARRRWGGTIAVSGMSRIGQPTGLGKLTIGSSLAGTMVRGVMYRQRWMAHSSFCSRSKAPTRWVMAA